MDIRRDLVLSSILNKIPHFKRIYSKMPSDIDIFANNIVKQIEEFCSRTIEIKVVSGLFIDDSEEDLINLDDSTDPVISESFLKRKRNSSSSLEDDIVQDPSFELEKQPQKTPLELIYSWERMQEITAMCAIKSRQSVASYLCKSKTDIDSIVRRVKEGPSKKVKMQILSQLLYSKFLEEDENGSIIKDETLIRFANEFSMQLNLDNFCSKSFIERFKKANRIVSRNITRIVQISKLKNHDQLLKNAQDFVDLINKKIENREYEINYIFNADQSKIEYEMTTQRTLTHKGVKEVNRACGSENSTTHSFTIMPTISRGGDLLPKIFVVLQETSGKFGVEVKKEVVKFSKVFKNLVITCSQSGKMENKHIKLWFETCIDNLVDKKSLLLLDSYGSHKTKKKGLNEEASSESGSNENLLSIEIIPKCTTGMIQPLDKFFFRQFKIVYRKMVNLQMQMNIREPTIYKPVHIREIQLRFVSLVHQQFKAPALRFMIRGAWNLCGYQLPDDEIYERFEAANQVLFNLGFEIKCSHNDCKKVSFIRCAFCRIVLCFDCFAHSDDHFHFDDNLEATCLNYEELGLVKESRRKDN